MIKISKQLDKLQGVWFWFIPSSGLCSILEAAYKEFPLALFWDLSCLISLSLVWCWCVLNLGSSQCVQWQGCISEGSKQDRAMS